MPLLQVLHHPPFEVGFNAPAYFFGSNHLHTVRQALNHISAEGSIAPPLPIKQWIDSVLPTAARITARKRSVGTNELMIRVSFPVRRFPATGYDNTGPISNRVFTKFHRSRQVHHRCHRT